MPDRSEMRSQDMHSETWWIRVMDDDLTEAERLRWEAHLAVCSRCQEEWVMLSRVDAFMAEPPPAPVLGPEFTALTVERIKHQRQWHRYLSFLGGLLVVLIAAALVLNTVGSALVSFEQGIGAVIFARQTLFHSLVQTFIGILVRWRTALPYIVGGALLSYAMMMPNGLLMTFAIVWLSSRRRACAAVGV